MIKKNKKLQENIFVMSNNLAKSKSTCFSNSETKSEHFSSMDSVSLITLRKLPMHMYMLQNQCRSAFTLIALNTDLVIPKHVTQRCLQQYSHVRNVSLSPGNSILSNHRTRFHLQKGIWFFEICYVYHS